MAAEDRIDSVIDSASVDKELATLDTKLKELAITLKTFPKADVFANVNSTKEQSEAQKQLSTVLDQLKVKNLELTVAQKQLSIAQKQAAIDAKAEADARKVSIQLAKDKAAADKQAAKDAVTAGREKILQLKQQQEAEESLAAAEKNRQEAEQGALSGTFTAGSSAKKQSAVQFSPTTDSDKLALSLIQDQRQLQATKDAQKLLTAEFAAGNISQAEYDAQLVKSIQLQQDLKVSIASTTKELSLQAKSNASIPGTITDLETRNAVLGNQRNTLINVVNATPEDVNNLKAVNDEIDKNNELIRVNKDLLAQQKINIGNYPTAFGGAFKTLNTELEQVQGKLVSGNFKGKELDELTAKATVLTSAIGATGKTFTSATAEQKAYKETAVQLALAFGQDSQVVKTFSSQVKDGSDKVNQLSSNLTKSSSASKGFGSALNTGYSALRKLANFLPNFGIGTAVLLLLAPLQSVGASIVRVFKNALENVTGLTAETKKKLKELADAQSAVNQEYIKNSTGSITKLERLREVITDTSKTEKERLAALRTYNKLADDNNKIDETQINNLNLINDNISKQISLIEKRGLAAASESIVTDRATKFLLAQEEAKTQALKDQENEDAHNIQTAESAKTDVYFKTLEREGAIRTKISKNAKVKQAKADLDAALQIAKQYEIPDPLSKPETGAANRHGLQELKDRLDNEFEIYKIAQQRKIALFEEDSKDTTKSFEDRLTALDNFNQAEQELLKKQEEYDIAAKQRETARDIQHLNEQKTGKTAAEKKRIDENIKIDQDNLQQSILLIQKKYGVDSLSIEDKTAKSRKEIVKQAYDYIRDTGIRAYEDIQKEIEKQAAEANAANDVSKNNKLLQLDKDFQAGKIKNLDDYAAKQQAIEDEAFIIEKLNDEKRIKNLELVFGASLELEQKLKDDEIAIEKLGNDKILAAKKDLADKEKELAKDVGDFIQDVLLSGIDNRSADLEKQSQNIDDKSQKEINAINASTLAQQDKAKRVAEIEKQAAFDHEQIQKKQDALDQRRKEIQRIAAIAEVSANIVKSVFDLQTKAAIARAEGASLAANPFTAPFAPAAFASAALISAQIPVVLGEGAIALAKAAFFEKGTDNAPKGPAVVGEKGSELMIKNGQMFLTPATPTLIDLAGGEKIFSHEVTKDMLKHMNMIDILANINNKKQLTKVDNFNEKMYRELRQLNGKAPFIIHVSEKFETTDTFRKHFKP